MAAPFGALRFTRAGCSYSPPAMPGAQRQEADSEHGRPIVSSSDQEERLAAPKFRPRRRHRQHSDAFGRGRRKPASVSRGATSTAGPLVRIRRGRAESWLDLKALLVPQGGKSRVRRADPKARFTRRGAPGLPTKRSFCAVAAEVRRSYDPIGMQPAGRRKLGCSSRGYESSSTPRERPT